MKNSSNFTEIFVEAFTKNVTNTTNKTEPKNLVKNALNNTLSIASHNDTSKNVSSKVSLKNLTNVTKSNPEDRPAILMTGATHSRELISIQMSLFSALKLIHQGIVHGDPTFQNLI